MNTIKILDSYRCYTTLEVTDSRGTTQKHTIPTIELSKWIKYFKTVPLTNE